MLRPRIIPCLLKKQDGLVKTVRFADPKYVGDPINAVRIFNEKAVDELIFLDIDATATGALPNVDLIRNVAAECRMPLCYGGGIKSVDVAARIIKLGVEKIAVSSLALDDPDTVRSMAVHLGSQSVVVVLDVKRNPRNGSYEVWTRNGTINTFRDVVDCAKAMEALGVGEITINSIDNEGTMQGYDLPLVRAVRDAVTLPMTALGGAGKLADIESLINEFGIIGAAAGSLFVFKGVYRAVLINYPNRSQKELLWSRTSAVQ
jgi:imidazole glycerol-phosphate synthase subunit HisF